MTVRLDYTNMMASAVGEATGIRDEELEALTTRAREIHHGLMARREKGFSPFYDLPFNRQMVTDVLKAKRELSGRFNTVVVLGIGGSALGTTALSRALLPVHHNLMDDSRRQGCRLFVLDNVDPSSYYQTLDFLDPSQTLFVVISKSGSTVETMCQFLSARSWVQDGVGSSWKDHFVMITDPVSGGLRRLSEEEGFRSFSVPERVGGRFSVFTPVGLLPLALAGIDVEGVLAGAAAMEKRVTTEDLFSNPAYLGAALHYLSYTKGQDIAVMMPYSDPLRDVADWFSQLWAESLGKRVNLAGEVVHVGPTPVKALGTTDQHSQVQLYMEGPFNKTVTFLTVENYFPVKPLAGYKAAPHLDYLQGHSLAELIAVEQKATAAALTKNGRPNCTLTLKDVSPETVGALLYMFEVQTVFAGGLFSINPLDQPGVEEGKQFTYGLMGRDGFEGKLAEYQSICGRNQPRIL